MKLKLLLLLLLAICQNVLAENTALVVLQTDGKKSVFLLSDKPEMTVSGSDCVFADKSRSIIIPRRDIKEFHFEKATASVETVEGVDVRTEFIDNSTLCITGVEPNAVKVYDLQGRIVNAEIDGTKDRLTVSLYNLPQGTYIVKYAGKSIKISKR